MCFEKQIIQLQFQYSTDYEIFTTTSDTVSLFYSFDLSSVQTSDSDPDSE